jgi:hypothetical protein
LTDVLASYDDGGSGRGLAETNKRLPLKKEITPDHDGKQTSSSVYSFLGSCFWS